MISRRHVIAGAAAIGFSAPAIVRAQSWFSDNPFGLGIAAGDPAPDGFVIWTKLSTDPLARHGGMPLSALPVGWEVAEDEGFRTVVASGEELARPELGHSVHVELTGLKPGRAYFYRFTVGGDRSLRGMAKTLPPMGSSPDSLRFGICGCQNYEDGYYGAFRNLAREDLAFVYHYGDFIYEYHQNYEFDASRLPTDPVRNHAFQNLYDLTDYRRAYGQYLTDMDLQAARGMHTWISTFDDHEIHNNWVSLIDQDPVPPEIFALRKQAAMQAWYEHMPVRKALLPVNGMVAANRLLNYGDLVAMHVLDTRQHRSDQPCNDGFRPACAGVDDNAAQVLGAAQEKWLDTNLGRGKAQWNCIAQQIMVMALDRRTRGEPEKILNLDSWAAYSAPRDRLLSRLEPLANAVILTGDEHQNFAGRPHYRDRPAAVEFVTTSISSGGDGSDLRPGSDKLLAGNGELEFVNDLRGYSVATVDRQSWRNDFMVMDRVSVPGGEARRRASATVPHGEIAFTLS
ncbi:MAG: alkaline phosphatase D family protein [Blastomonas sp.]